VDVSASRTGPQGVRGFAIGLNHEFTWKWACRRRRCIRFPRIPSMGLVVDRVSGPAQFL